MSRLFMWCLLLFFVAAFAVYTTSLSAEVRIIAAAVVFVLTCAGFGALFGELFSKGWKAANKKTANAAKCTKNRARFFAKHLRKSSKTPEDRL